MAVLTADFSAFVESAQPRLRLALGSAFGFELAEEATAEALAFAWEHWERVASMDNPVGYVFGVARNKIRRTFTRRHPQLPPVRETDLPWVEPRLPAALGHLPERQRQVVMLLHCFQWTLSEVAAVLDLSKGTVQIHDRRGLARLRRELGYGNE
jgi:RNA polymerase sigma factor (sigma-70 family)